MVHFFGIFAPAQRKANDDQQSFFSDAGPSKAESDAELLAGKRPPQAEEPLDDRDPDFVATRFVTLLSPPYI